MAACSAAWCLSRRFNSGRECCWVDRDALRDSDGDWSVLVEEHLGAHNRDSHELAFPVVPECMALGRLVEVHRFARVACMEVEHVGVRVIVHVIEGGLTDRDTHGMDLR